MITPNSASDHHHAANTDCPRPPSGPPSIPAQRMQQAPKRTHQLLPTLPPPPSHSVHPILAFPPYTPTFHPRRVSPTSPAPVRPARDGIPAFAAREEAQARLPREEEDAVGAESHCEETGEKEAFPYALIQLVRAVAFSMSSISF